MVGSEIARPAGTTQRTKASILVRIRQSRGRQMLLQCVLASRQERVQKEPQLNGTPIAHQEPW
jgi:hypothetical protein